MYFELFYILLILFIGSFLTGITGFGGNLIAIPLLMAVMPAHAAIVFGCVTGVATVAVLAFIYRRNIPVKEIAWLSLGSILGIPGGVWVLANVEQNLLFLGSGLGIIAFLAWQFASSRLQSCAGMISAGWSLPFGLISGFVTGAVGMGGPPLAVYAFMRRWGKEQSLGGISAVFVVQILIAVPIQMGVDLMAEGMFSQALWGAIIGIIGILASKKIVRKINVALFRKLLLGMLAFSAMMLLLRGI